MSKFTPRSEEEKLAIRRYLSTNYATTPWPEMLAATGCSKPVIYHFASVMGLRRSAQRTKDQQFVIGAARVVKEYIAPSAKAPPIRNSNAKGTYNGSELRSYSGRPGAMDAYALPSLALGKRLYRDGRVEAV